MTIREFATQDLDDLIIEARASPRSRMHRNVHATYDDPCQRLFNAIEPDSYIRPHRHARPDHTETMIAVRGKMALLAFDDAGNVIATACFGAQLPNAKHSAVVEVPAGVWHTVVAIESGSVLLEVKAGPFDPEAPKEAAGWAPAEGAPEAATYLTALRRSIRSAE